MRTFSAWLDEQKDPWDNAQKEIEEVARLVHLGVGSAMKDVDSTAFRSRGRYYPALKFTVDKPLDEVNEFLSGSRDFQETREQGRYTLTKKPEIMVRVFRESGSATAVTIVNKESVE